MPPLMPVHGYYEPGPEAPSGGRPALIEALERLDRPFAVVSTPSGPAVATGGRAVLGGPAPAGALPLLAHVPALTPDRLGDPAFRSAHGLRVAYVAGAMANGIGSVEIVVAMARAGMLESSGPPGSRRTGSARPSIGSATRRPGCRSR